MRSEIDGLERRLAILGAGIGIMANGHYWYIFWAIPCWQACRRLTQTSRHDLDVVTSVSLEDLLVKIERREVYDTSTGASESAAFQQDSSRRALGTGSVSEICGTDASE